MDKKIKSNQNPLFMKLAAFATGIFIIAAISLLYYVSDYSLIKKFSHEDPKIRRWAVDQMVKKGDSVGEKMLSLATDQNGDAEVRRLSIFVLGEVRYKPSIPKLLSILKSEEEPLRGQSAYALGRIGDVSVLPILLSTYSDADKSLRLKIVIALGELGTAESATALDEMMENDDELIAEAARYARSKIREKEGI